MNPYMSLDLIPLAKDELVHKDANEKLKGHDETSPTSSCED